MRMSVDHPWDDCLASQVDVIRLDLAVIVTRPDLADVAACLVDRDRDAGQELLLFRVEQIRCVYTDSRHDCRYRCLLALF